MPILDAAPTGGSREVEVAPVVAAGIALPPKKPADSNNRLTYLDGLRGAAALMVVLFHLWGDAGSPSWIANAGRLLPGAPALPVDLLSPVRAFGGTRVSLFFVLSGFLLYLPFASRTNSAGSLATSAASNGRSAPARTSLASWLWRRFSRLAPPYYAAIPLALSAIAGSFYVNEAWRVAVKHLPPRAPDFGTTFNAFPSCLFFLHGLFPGQEMPGFNGPLWTLTPEVELYLAFPLLLALAGTQFRLGNRRISGLFPTVIVAFALSVAYRILLYDSIGYALPAAHSQYLNSAYHCLVNTFLGRWAEFAAGMAAAGLVIRGRVAGARYLLPAVLVCLAWFLVLRSDMAVRGWVGEVFLAGDPTPSPLADAMGGVTFALLILCCAGSPRLARWFSVAPLCYVGQFAYSLYLIHTPVIGWFSHLLTLCHFDPVTQIKAGHGLAVLVVNILLGLPVCLVSARLFWWCFERPFQKSARNPKRSSAAVLS